MEVKTNDVRLRNSRTQDLLLVFIFLVILIIFHIFLVQLSSKDLNVDIKQRIILQNEGPIIHFKSPTKEKLQLLEKQRHEKSYWNIPAGEKMTPYHLKYHPVKTWPAGVDDAAVWKYFQTECSKRNISETELVHCAYDSEMFRRR